MSDFITRLETESNELVEKMEKLSAFIASDNFDKIDSSQKSLLKIQWQAMQTYNLCLAERLNLLKK